MMIKDHLPWEGSSRSGLGPIGGSEVLLAQDGDAVHEEAQDDDDEEDDMVLMTRTRHQ